LASAVDGVTSVATGYGISGGTITSTGTLTADTSSLSTKPNTQKVVDDSSKVLRALAGSSVARLSTLLGSTATNTIDNADYNQTWTWNTLTGDALTLSSNATTGASNNKILEIIRSGANSSSSIISYGIHSSVTNTGTSSTNYAGYFTASGGTANVGVVAEGTTRGIQGSSSSSFGEGVRGSVSSSNSSGVYGTATASSSNGVYGNATAANSTGVKGTVTATTGTNYGSYSEATGSGATTNYGGYFTATGASTNYGVYATGTTYALYANNTASSGQGITSFVNGSNSRSIEAYNSSTSGTNYGIYAQASGSGGTNNYALFLNATGATNNYALVTTSGNIGFGTNTPSSTAIVEISSTTQGLLLPRMTKTQRDAIGSPVAGLMVYQTDNTPGLRVYNGTNWMRYTETAD
jgi:hypothetical protein